MLEVKISYDRDPEAGAGEHPLLGAALAVPGAEDQRSRPAVEMERPADELPIEQVAKRWIVSSDPDEAVAKVKDYVNWGLNHLVFHAPGHDQRRFLELFQKDLEPRLRRLG